MVCSLQVSRGVGGSIGLESDPRDRRPRLKVGSRALPPRRKVNHRPGSQEPQTVEPPVPVLATPSRGGAPTKEQEVSIFAIRVGRAGSLLLPFTVIPPSRRIFGSSQRWTRAVPSQPGGRRAGQLTARGRTVYGSPILRVGRVADPSVLFVCIPVHSEGVLFDCLGFASRKASPSRALFDASRKSVRRPASWRMSGNTSISRNRASDGSGRKTPPVARLPAASLDSSIVTPARARPGRPTS